MKKTLLNIGGRDNQQERPKENGLLGRLILWFTFLIIGLWVLIALLASMVMSSGIWMAR
jgi:hypothetical protein